MTNNLESSVFDNDLPEFSNCVIAYIDLMGIKEKINSQYTLTTIWILLKRIAQLCENNKRLYYKAFSDNIIICEQIDDSNPIIALNDVLNIVREIEFFMFHIEVPFVRGAIVVGSIYFNDDYVFGEALLKAYRIEQNDAIFPRIIVDKSVFNILEHNKSDYIIKDRDGLYFYDFMAAKINEINLKIQTIRALKANILWNLQVNCKNTKIVSKMEWLVNYFNESCRSNNIQCQITEKELNDIGISCELLRLIALKENDSK